MKSDKVDDVCINHIFYSPLYNPWILLIISKLTKTNDSFVIRDQKLKLQDEEQKITFLMTAWLFTKASNNIFYVSGYLSALNNSGLIWNILLTGQKIYIYIYIFSFCLVFTDWLEIFLWHIILDRHLRLFFSYSINIFMKVCWKQRMLS